MQQRPVHLPLIAHGQRFVVADQLRPEAEHHHDAKQNKAVKAQAIALETLPCALPR